MKPVLKDGVLSVELNVHEKGTLAKAREIGETLEALHQRSGADLVVAIDAILSCDKVEEPAT